MTIADKIGAHTARIVINTTPHGVIQDNLFVCDYQKLILNMKAEFLAFARDLGALEQQG